MRRLSVTTAVVFAVVFFLAAVARAADDYPSRPIRIISILPPGGSVDVLARLVSEPLSARFKQPVIIESRQGAGGNIAASYVARAPADGYTILITSNNHTVNPMLYREAGYTLADFTPVIGLMRTPSAISASLRSGFRNLQEVIAAARQAPGEIAYGSAGNGLPSHLSGELLKKMAGIDLVHVPYRGSGPSLAAVLGGQIPLVISSLVAAAPHYAAGKLTAIAVTSKERWPALPAVPTVAESGVPGFAHDAWVGLFVHSATPETIVQTLNAAIADILADPAVAARIYRLGGTTAGLTDRSAFATFVAADAAFSRDMVDALNLKID